MRRLGCGSRKTCRWSKAATRRMCRDSSIPLPKTSPDTSIAGSAALASRTEGATGASERYRAVCFEWHATTAVTGG